MQDPQITKQYLKQCSHLVLWGPIQIGDSIKRRLKCFTACNPPRTIKIKLYEDVMMTSDT